MFKDVTVGNDTEGTEDNPNGNVYLDVGDGRLYDIPELDGVIRQEKACYSAKILTERS